MKFAKTMLAIGVTLFTLAAAGCAMDDPPSDASLGSSAPSNIYFGN